MSLIVAPTLDDLGAKPGDLIECRRTGYEHWAVRVDDGNFVHLASRSEGLGSGSNSMASVGSGNAVVKMDKYSDVVRRSKCRVNNTLDDVYKPRPADVVVREARALVGRPVTYRLLELNCEHFANYLRYGVAESGQALRAGIALKVIGILAAIVLAAIALAAIVWTIVRTILGTILEGSSKEKKGVI